MIGSMIGGCATSMAVNYFMGNKGRSYRDGDPLELEISEELVISEDEKDLAYFRACDILLVSREASK
jgi:hypothetical protein